MFWSFSCGRQSAVVISESLLTSLLTGKYKKKKRKHRSNMGRSATKSKWNKKMKRIKRQLYEPYYIQHLEQLGAKLDEVRGFMPREIPETPLDAITEKITPYVHQHPFSKQNQQTKNADYDISFEVDTLQTKKPKPMLRIETQFTELNPTTNPFHANNDKDNQLSSNKNINDNNTFEDDDDVEMGGLESSVGKLTKKKLMKAKAAKAKQKILKAKIKKLQKLGVEEMDV